MASDRSSLKSGAGEDPSAWGAPATFATAGMPPPQPQPPQPAPAFTYADVPMARAVAPGASPPPAGFGFAPVTVSSSASASGAVADPYAVRGHVAAGGSLQAPGPGVAGGLGWRRTVSPRQDRLRWVAQLQCC